MFKNIKKVHFVGIGGIGMSGIAEILFNQGFEISGSDKNLSEVTKRLSDMGMTVYEGHSPENLKDADVLVYSSAVTLDNPEVKSAAERDIPIIKRAEMLAECMRMKYGIGIAGTHGKTTTTSMVGLTLTEGGIDPTIIVGGKLSGLGGTNARLGQGEFIVVEADEFDRTFLKLTPTVAALTTLESEHLDTYKDLDDIKRAFTEFANKVPFYGFVVLCIDESELQNIKSEINKKVITYGLSEEANLRAVNIKHNKFNSFFTAIYNGKELGEIKLNIPGKHNIKNSLVAVCIGLELGIEFIAIKTALEKFTGVYRRFEVKYNKELLVVDDYAHHPTETSATLSGIREGWKNRLVVVFQPHLYTRTRDFYKEFAKSFINTDLFICTDVYPAREEKIEGVTGKLITDALEELGHTNVKYVKDKNDVPDLLNKLKEDGDIIVTMGAGDIWKYGDQFVEMLNNKN
ncbi:MAG: UDP-N-acetylmuramate--L-alanine ligase [Ignavibacteriales bacterium CG12_big_fil_rev_8_21_14_0_65_30_8]|nr:MAG: UDP-N-acetylmuramate--L-alanine ligase [Ignavibacteriales bacterium CG12_big_fil_rev_8_21_14_0_65_30_8]